MSLDNNLLKLSIKNVISKALTILFNLSMIQGKFLQGFKIAKVVPIYKDDDHVTVLIIDPFQY